LLLADLRGEITIQGYYYDRLHIIQVHHQSYQVGKRFLVVSAIGDFPLAEMAILRLSFHNRA